MKTAGEIERSDRTRERVARSILDHGPSSAADLADRLELTQAAVRKHLDHLQADGLVAGREERVYGHRGRGRPRQLFSLTDSGRHAFFTAYDELAADLLGFLADDAGPAAVGRFAVRRAAVMETRYAGRVGRAAQNDAANANAANADTANVDAAELRALADLLTADGYAATVREVAGERAGEQLCQHQCPIARVAAKYPQLCEAETEAIGRLLGRPVRRLATIAHGDGVCTTHVSPQLTTKSAQRSTSAYLPPTSTSATPQSSKENRDDHR